MWRQADNYQYKFYKPLGFPQKKNQKVDLDRFIRS